MIGIWLKGHQCHVLRAKIGEICAGMLLLHSLSIVSIISNTLWNSCRKSFQVTFLLLSFQVVCRRHRQASAKEFLFPGSSQTDTSQACRKFPSSDVHTRYGLFPSLSGSHSVCWLKCSNACRTNNTSNTLHAGDTLTFDLCWDCCGVSGNPRLIFETRH